MWNVVYDYLILPKLSVSVTPRFGRGSRLTLLRAPVDRAASPTWGVLVQTSSVLG